MDFSPIYESKKMIIYLVISKMIKRIWTYESDSGSQPCYFIIQFQKANGNLGYKKCSSNLRLASSSSSSDRKSLISNNSRIIGEEEVTSGKSCSNLSLFIQSDQANFLKNIKYYQSYSYVWKVCGFLSLLKMKIFVIARFCKLFCKHQMINILSQFTGSQRKNIELGTKFIEEKKNLLENLFQFVLKYYKKAISFIKEKTIFNKVLNRIEKVGKSLKEKTFLIPQILFKIVITLLIFMEAINVFNILFQFIYYQCRQKKEIAWSAFYLACSVANIAGYFMSGPIFLIINLSLTAFEFFLNQSWKQRLMILVKKIFGKIRSQLFTPPPETIQK